MFGLLTNHVCNETIVEFGFGFRGVYTKGHCFQVLLSFHNPLFSTYFNDSFDKLEAEMSVISAYQWRAGLIIYRVENLVSY